MFEELLTNHQRVTRRQLFGAAGQGIGAIALASLLESTAAAGTKPTHGGQPGLPHFPPKANRVVCLWQGGGPSHVDLFDPKPTLFSRKGEDIPESVRGTTRLSTMTASVQRWPIQPAIKPFKRHGQWGTELRGMLALVGLDGEEVCRVRSMNTEGVNPAPGGAFFMTGAQVPGRPSMGAWLNYGLGSIAD